MTYVAFLHFGSHDGENPKGLSVRNQQPEEFISSEGLPEGRGDIDLLLDKGAKT